MLGLLAAALLLTSDASGGTPAVPVAIEAPQFPDVCIKANLSGTVMVSICVSPDGSVASADILGKPLPILAGSAEAAALRWRFPPSSTGYDRVLVLRFDFVIISEPPHAPGPCDRFVGPVASTFLPPHTVVVTGVQRLPPPTVN